MSKVFMALESDGRMDCTAAERHGQIVPLFARPPDKLFEPDVAVRRFAARLEELGYDARRDMVLVSGPQIPVAWLLIAAIELSEQKFDGSIRLLLFNAREANYALKTMRASRAVEAVLIAEGKIDSEEA